MRTALRDFTRTYAFLAQIMPFADAELEALYYYGKYLLTRLLPTDPGEAVNLDGSVILTHLRQELIADQIILSLTEGTDEPLHSLSTAEGKQHTPAEEHLSALIAALNEKFGLNLGDADLIWFEQQQQALADQPDVQAAAHGNDIVQFGTYVKPKMDIVIADRHGANDELFRAYFDKPDFRDLMVEAIITTLYHQLREQTA